MTNWRHPYDLETPSRDKGPRGGSRKPRVHYVRKNPPQNAGYVKQDRVPPPIKLRHLDFTDPAKIAAKPEHLR